MNKFFKCTSLLLVLVIFSFSTGYGQVLLPSFPENTFPNYYWQKVTHFEMLPKSKGATIFIGDSITDGAEWAALFQDPNVLNFGVSGDISAGVLNRLPDVVKLAPKKIFILIGVNDISRNISADSVYRNINLAVRYIHLYSRSTQVFIQSILPVNDNLKSFSSHTGKVDSILKVNALLSKGAASLKYTWLNLYSSFCDNQGKLKREFTNDGLHLKGAGYALWKHLIYNRVYDLQEEPALIPRPKLLTMKSGLFPLYQVKYICYQTDSLRTEAEALQKILAASGIRALLTKQREGPQVPYISLEISSSPSAEAYQLQVSAEKVLITASATAGLFHGIQTLRQLGRDGYFINAVDVSDEPAFSWRGYMVDVGRNYQSVALLKQQIDIMAAYKLNVFHLHLTEDIAWRLAISRYPQLTHPEFMERNKGMYYSVAEIRDLIVYCKQRHILFVPEIDVPGHSAAFKKAMKTDMQSDSGLVMVKNILKEVAETYDVPYIHIGADEVKITNEAFLPEISAFLKSLNKKVIGWEPGGNFSQSTIRQLWMDDAGLTKGTGKIKYIDSRHLYLNHMDPLESVVTIFNRQLADRDRGNAEALGATLCLWPDRAVAREEDMISMNAVYPAMLAFAERSWAGGGHSGWVANMNLDGQTALHDFTEFENRLMDHKKEYFSALQFPYQRQSDLVWNLYGPYDNQGDTEKQFLPERSDAGMDQLKISQTAIGGTIVLRHWWAPKIRGVLKDPKENTTWYAVRKIWSERDTVLNFWIGLTNFSRSQATDSSPAGEWDTHHSEITLNNQIVPAPPWLHAGQKGDLEIPLADEGYESRPPTALRLEKGWNTVRIKVPIGSFKGRNWNNPEKWMFTFVEVKD